MTEMPIAPEPEPLAQRAARAVIERVKETEPEVEIEDGESALSALGWIMGVEISYEQGLEKIVAEAIRLHDAEREPLAFRAGDDVVTWFEDDAGVWSMLELTELAEGGDEWRTVASLMLSDVEAADLARRLTDRTSA